MRFIDIIFNRAMSDRRTIVLPESKDIRVLKAASLLQEKGIADIILIGNETEIKNIVPDLNFKGVKFVDPLTYPGMNDLIALLYSLRKEKGVTPGTAAQLLSDPLYLGVMLVKTGIAHGMVAGAIHATSETLRPALQILRTKKGTNLVSGFFIMDVPDCEYGNEGLFIFADCGVVENPTAEQLADIAIESAKSFESLVQAEPKVAMLSYSTYGSAKSILTEKVVKATLIAKEKAPGILIDGELQADAALVPSVSASKAKGSIVGGQANVLVFPDLNSGNIAYKLVQRLAKADAYGPITQGIARPVNDLSRGCTVDDILGVVAITAVQSQGL